MIFQTVSLPRTVKRDEALQSQGGNTPEQRGKQQEEENFANICSCSWKLFNRGFAKVRKEVLGVNPTELPA